ncbi:MAG: PH domain-containing protein [Pirellulaceae bacterium]
MTPPSQEFDPTVDPGASPDSDDLVNRESRSGGEEFKSARADELADGLANRLGLDETFERLAPQQVKFEQRVGYIIAAVLTVVAVVASIATFLNLRSEWWYFPALAASWVLFIAMSVFYSHFWPKVQYEYTGYRLGDAGMEILRGVLWRHKISIPLARVQHVDVSQGPVQRMFDLGTLAVHTAGTKNASIELDGLQHATAVQLRDRLIEQRETLDVT